MKKLWKIFSRAILVLLIVVAVAAVGVRLTGRDISILGYRQYYVVTGSMEPTLHIGDVVLCRERSAQQLREGDILVYHGTEGELAGKTITHRIIADPVQTENGWQIQTRGDAQGAVPDPLVGESQVIGVVVAKLRLVSALYRFFITPWGLLAVAAPLIWALISEIRNLVSIAKEERNNDAEK